MAICEILAFALNNYELPMRCRASTFTDDCWSRILAADGSVNWRNGPAIMRGHPSNWRAAKTAFNPPKANELLKITRTGKRRASFGT